MLGDIGDIIYDLAGTRAYRNCRSFVEHLPDTGPNHPMEKSFKNAFDANQKNTADFLAGKFTPQFHAKIERLYIQGLMPATTPAGIVIDDVTKNAFLSSHKLTDLPATALETKITRENWVLKRQLKQNNFLDQFHVMALPYVDLFITNDDKLSRLMKRAVAGMPFRTAEIVTKDEFDARFPLTAQPKTISVEERIRVRLTCCTCNTGEETGSHWMIGFKQKRKFWVFGHSDVSVFAGQAQRRYRLLSDVRRTDRSSNERRTGACGEADCGSGRQSPVLSCRSEPTRLSCVSMR